LNLRARLCSTSFRNFTFLFPPSLLYTLNVSTDSFSSSSSFLLISCKYSLKIRPSHSYYRGQEMYNCCRKTNCSDMSFVSRGNTFRELDQKWSEDNSPTGGHANIWNLAKRMKFLALIQRALLCTAFFIINDLVCGSFCRRRSW